MDTGKTPSEIIDENNQYFPSFPSKLDLSVVPSATISPCYQWEIMFYAKLLMHQSDPAH